MTGKRLDQKEAWNINLPSQGVMNGLLSVPVPTLAAVGGVPQRTYFLELLLKRGTRIIDRNVYWLSTVGDVPTYTGNAYPNLSTYGDLRNLQTPTQDPPVNQPQVQPAPQKPEPPPNIPLFPRYRRGLYKNGLGLWVIDGPPQSPPLFTDDPGVPDKGEWEINFTVRGDLAKSEKQVDFFHADINYGVLPKWFGHEVPIQLKIEAPISGFKESGEPFGTGVGPVEGGVKINFYNNDDKGIALSVYPQFEFGLGDTFVDKGLVDAGQTFIFPVLVSKQYHFVTLVFNGGIEHAINDPDRETMGTAGVSEVGFRGDNRGRFRIGQTLLAERNGDDHPRGGLLGRQGRNRLFPEDVSSTLHSRRAGNFFVALR
jgi:hypothetical protein